MLQKHGAEDEEEQVLSMLMSKGASEAALTDEMGRLRVQEEVALYGLLNAIFLLTNAAYHHYLSLQLDSHDPLSFIIRLVCITSLQPDVQSSLVKPAEQSRLCCRSSAITG